MPDRLTFSILDYSGETGKFLVNVPTLTAANFAAQHTLYDDFQDAVLQMIAGNFKQRDVLSVTRLGQTRPSDPVAQREFKWVVTYEDVTEFLDAPTNAVPNPGYRKPFDVEIPTADVAGTTMTPNTDLVDLTAAPVPNFIIAFEALVKSPYGGSSNVLQIRLAGRNV